MSQYVVSANRVVASGWMEGSVAGQRRSMIEGILTCVMVRFRVALT
jgi:hypothetical protein